VAENVPGDFFVDSTCIDCDACRQIAPTVFGEAAETSFVKVQPGSSTDRRQALRALLACPTGSIGCLGDDDVKAVMKDFPLVVEEPVFYCGYNSPKSYGGNSYFIRHSAGNWWWNDSTVVKLATAIYDELRFQDMPILADALEESGCDNPDILNHCRQPGEHVKGCWVVDLILSNGFRLH
jgi:ferredoxin